MSAQSESNTNHSSGLPASDQEPDVAYSIEVIASLAGMDSVTVLHYQELGVVSPKSGGQEARFDEEALRRLRRIGHLREECGVNDSGIKLILTLMEEVEILRDEQRKRRHV